MIILKRYFLYCCISGCLALTGYGPASAQDTYNAGIGAASLEPKDFPFSIALAGYGVPRGGRFSIDWKAATVPVSIFKPGKPGPKWKAVVQANRFPKGTRSVVEYQDRLMVLTDADELYQLDLTHITGEWIRFAAFNGSTYDVHLKSIAVYKGQLYGLSKDDKMYRAEHSSVRDLSVRAVAISQGKQTAVLVGADLCGFNKDFTDIIKKEAFRKFGLPPESILINASHTHFAPSTQDWTTWGSHQLPDTVYLNGVVKPAMLKAIGQALKNRKPAELSFGRGKTAIGKNRSLTGNDVPYDDALDVLSIVSKKNKERSLVFLTGCHPVFRNEGPEGNRLNANYPGVTKQLLEQEGIAKHTLFLQGCGGDINPVSTDHTETGKQLAKEIKDVLQTRLVKLVGGINFALDSISFPVVPWDEKKIKAFRRENDQDTKDVNLEKNVRWADLMLKLIKEKKMLSQMPVYLQTINVGNWKLLGLSREVTTSYSLGIKALWPEKLVSVAGYSNDVSSYLPTSRHIQAGTYEGSGSFFWYGQPSVFPMDVYEQILSRIKANNY